MEWFQRCLFDLFNFWGHKKRPVQKGLKKNGGGVQVLVEHNSNINYLSVFITHFLVSPAKNTAILRKLYLDLGLRTRQIEEISSFSWAKTSITMALQHANISRPKRNSNPKYGYRNVGGIHIPHKGEQKIIKKIIALRQRNLSLREIAQSLADLGIEKRSGGKFDKTTINAIIKRHESEEL